jgi:hypothetical protein
MTSSDKSWLETIQLANDARAVGATIWQKWTCSACGTRQTMETPNTFYQTGKCEECGKVTDIEKQGHGFMALLTLT